MRISILTAGLAVSMLTASAAETDKHATPTFNHDVAPILYNNCSGCHRPGEVAPFALLTYDDAAKRAKQIAAVTAARYMPPWKAEPGYGHFLNERRLTDEQLATLRDWAANGAPEGDAAQKPVPPTFRDGWQIGEPDQIVKMAKPYSLPAEGADVFRCFVIPLNATDTEYVSKVEFRPGNRRVVHHAILFLDRTGEASRREKVPGEGYECVGGPGLAISGGLGGWAPGATPTEYRDGVAQTIPKGADLVMQIHYHLSGKPEEDDSQVGITFAKTPPTKGLTLITVGNTNIDIPAGDDHYVVKASSTVPEDAERDRRLPARALPLQGHESGCHAPGWHRGAAHLDQGLGFQLAGCISLRQPGEAAERHRNLDEVHLRQLGRQPAQSEQSPARGEVRRTDHQRDGIHLRSVEPGRAR